MPAVSIIQHCKSFFFRIIIFSFPSLYLFLCPLHSHARTRKRAIKRKTKKKKKKMMTLKSTGSITNPLSSRHHTAIFRAALNFYFFFPDYQPIIGDVKYNLITFSMNSKLSQNSFSQRIKRLLEHHSLFNLFSAEYNRSIIELTH